MEPVSSDDNPNKALPRVNAVNEGDADATQEERCESDPVTRSEFEAIRSMQKDTAETMARIESALLAKLAEPPAKKRKRDNARGECDRTVRPRKSRRVASAEESLDDEEVEDEVGRHVVSSSSPIFQRALKFLPANKGWKVCGAFGNDGLPVAICNVLWRVSMLTCCNPRVPPQEICEQLRVHLFLNAKDTEMSFYPSSAAKSAGLCAIIERLTPAFASLALAADKGRRADLNRALSDWKTGTAGRVHDIALPKLGLFRDERDESSPWAAPKARSAKRVKERVGLTIHGEEVFTISKWSEDRRGMPSASGAFAACARAAFRPRMVNGCLTLKLYQMAWLEHVLGDVSCVIVDGLRECALVDVRAAIEQFQPQYDPIVASWAWGRHGLRLSASGIQGHEAAAQEPSESAGDAGDASLA
ncbi:unnamed protein product [Closterium sp. Naga37s-1]|nr:unnamed protein product [Closterium sp. Naga37s-1]